MVISRHAAHRWPSDLRWRDASVIVVRCGDESRWYDRTRRIPARKGPMLPITLDDIRLFVHVCAAVVWVGGTLVWIVLMPTLPRVGADAPAAVARRLSPVLWGAFALLVRPPVEPCRGRSGCAKLGLPDHTRRQARGGGDERSGGVRSHAGVHDAWRGVWARSAACRPSRPCCSGSCSPDSPARRWAGRPQIFGQPSLDGGVLQRTAWSAAHGRRWQVPPVRAYRRRRG